MSIKTPGSVRRRGWIALLASVAIASSLPARSHIVKEEPWHPVPAAYQRALFYGNLKPVPWDLIEAEFGSPIAEPGFAGKTVYDLLGEAGKTGRLQVDQITKAVADQDRQALYAATTRAVAAQVRHHLHEAHAELDVPGGAQRAVLTASKIFRAFGQDAIRRVDPEASVRLGRAWLALTSSVGTQGVLGIGEQAADRERFEAARQEIEAYLAAAYEVDVFAERATLIPYPELRDADGGIPSVRSRESIQALARRLPPGANLNDQDPLPLLNLNFEARGIDEADLFLVAYGDMVFDSPMIFGEPARSLGIACSTCHNRSDINQDFFIPGLSPHPGAVDVDGEFFNPRFNDRRDDPLDIPSLRGLRFTAPYGRDGRIASLRDFVRNVIVNEFAGPEPSPLVLDSLTAYILEFDWLPTPHLLPDGRLKASVGEAARRGEVLFNTAFEGLGQRKCSTCHVPSSNFIDGRQHDIGSGERSGPDSRDSFFDTPTLIGSLYTAPYMHDGSLQTLGDVVAWFNAEHALGLSPSEEADLTAYLEAVGSSADPYEIFDDENTPFALAWSELSTFMTTLDTLIPSRDTEHALLLLDTVATDLRLDLSMSRQPGRIAPQVYAIADTLDAIKAAIQDDDWARAAALNDDYKILAERHGPELK